MPIKSFKGIKNIQFTIFKHTTKITITYYLLKGDYMNAINIKKSLLEQAITNMQCAINKKNAIDITSNISIETNKEGNLILKATDHETYIKTTLKPESIQGEIKCAINGEIISNILKELNDTVLTIEKDSDNNIFIKQNNSSVFKLPIFEISEFPFSQNYKDENQNFKKMEIDNNFLLQSFKKVIHCCNDKDTFNIAMQGILLENINKKLSIVATDSKRLGYIQKDTENIEDFISIIPKKTINEVLKLFNAECEIYIKNMKDTNKIEIMGFISKDIEFYSKLISGNFPDFTVIVSNKPKIPTIKINKEKLLKAINQINTICQRTKIIFKKDEIVFEELEGINGASASVTIKGIENQKSKDITIGIANKHLLECISNIKYDDIEIIIDEPQKPIFITTQDFEEIIMPQII